MVSFYICLACRTRLWQLYKLRPFLWQPRASVSILPSKRREYTDDSIPKDDATGSIVTNNLPSYHHENFRAPQKGYLASVDINEDNFASSSLMQPDYRSPVRFLMDKGNHSQRDVNRNCLPDTKPEIRKHTYDNATSKTDKSFNSDHNAPSPKISFYNIADFGTREHQPENNSGKSGVKIRFTNVRPESSHLTERSHSSEPPRNDKLISIFKGAITSPNSQSAPNNLFLAHLKYVNALGDMISNKKSLSEIWKYVQEHFDNDGRRINFNSNLKHMLLNLLNTIVDSKRANPHDPLVPGITEVADFYSRSGLLHGEEWADLVISLLEKVSLTLRKPLEDKLLVSDILGAWDVASKKPGETVVPLSPAVAKKIYQENGLNYLFRVIVPQLNSGSAKLPLVAIATFAVLTNQSLGLDALSPSYIPLVQNLANVINVHGLDISQIMSQKQSVVKLFVVSNWAEIRETASRISNASEILERNQLPSSQKTPYNVSTTALTRPTTLIRSIDSIHHKLKSAQDLKNHILVDELWSQVATWPVPPPKSRPGISNRNEYLSLELCNQFIMVYMDLHRPQKSIKVWNHMMERGLQPTSKTWNSLMSGCRAVRDWRSSETIWSKMIHTGLRPDVISWSTRISVLIESKEIDMAIRSLDQMGRLWLAAAIKKHPKMSIPELQLLNDVEDAAKPDIGCLNSAITGLLAQGKTGYAYQTLDWASKLGIKPDIVTYNIFLRPLVRSGKRREAMLLLKRMQQVGIEADVVTFTIILDEVLRDPKQYSPEQQKKMVDDIFADMKRVNVVPNERTFGKIIYQLVRDFDSANSPTVSAVLQRMHVHGVNPSVGIYTSLVKYCLLQDPPDLETAQRIIGQATAIVGLDRVFWDTVVGCYAQVGDTTTALTIIARMSSRHMRVGWAAMRSVLGALVAKNELELARGFVQDVEMNVDRHDFRLGTLGEKQFWEMVQQLNLAGG